MNIHDKLTEIQNRIKVKKNHYNKFANYQYRNAADILKELKPLCKEYKCCIVIDVKYIGDNLIECTAIFRDNLQKIKARSVVGVEMDQKGQQMPQRFGSANTYAKKYALDNLLGLDDWVDSDDLNEYIEDDPEDDKSKDNLLENTPNWNKVVKGLNDGYTIEDVQKKYTVTTAQIEKLKKHTKTKLQNKINEYEHIN
tara:strand:+ start:711 stop:1301 length:591 start_codon:yes stop_codon:yes gene_type:complete